MEGLKAHELFEINTLKWLKNRRFLAPLVFGGGTMLRLCHELPRYSVDLDFWFYRETDYTLYFENLARSLRDNFNVSDAAENRFTLKKPGTQYHLFRLLQSCPAAIPRRKRGDVWQRLQPRPGAEKVSPGLKKYCLFE